jgi:penicillin-binding protein 1C
MFPKYIRIFLAIIIFALLSLLLPPKKDSGSSRILFSSSGELLRVWLNKNKQYQFPESKKISEKYKTAVLHFEDKRFYRHFGIDFIAVVRAIKQNFRAGKIESGASTITMQLARLKNPSKRTFFAKLRETHAALRMEMWHSKDEIFAEYSSLAPMGGNIVGAETACWRFFGHPLETLTWAEAALLALLPNRPSALNLKKERAFLLERRNNLLKSLAAANFMDAETLSSALQEPLPKSNAEWRFKTPHYAEAAATLFPNHINLHGTIDSRVQENLEQIAKNYGKKTREYLNVNMSVLIAETKTGKIRGYLGSLDYYDSLSRGMIDGVRAHRSTGSILKPFLYALAIERGPYTPESLIEDIPAWYRGFSPQNADKKFSGLVALKDALTNSLNVPAVKVLADYGVEDFHYWLKNAGLKKLFRTPEDYGLSLILGGAEASLQELVPLYSMLMNNGKRTELKWVENETEHIGTKTEDEELLQAVTAYHIRKILVNVKPGEIPVAWKTGTSYGSRDAWAIGVNEQWTIGVWVGNFEGGSVNGLSGANTAVPLLFSLFNALSDRKKELWSDMPKDANFETVEICNLSGYKASEFCIEKHTIMLTANRSKNLKCHFHKKTIISKSSGFEVCSLCWNVEDTLHIIEAHYTPAVRSELRKVGREPAEEILHNPICRAKKEALPFSIAYPENGARLFLPSKDALSEMGFIALAVHKQREAELHWFLNGAFLGNTKGDHKMPITIGTGEYRLGVQDALGRYVETKFKVISN